jgi:hypothetical protein
MNPDTDKRNHSCKRIVVLGDGDFSYSYDLAQSLNNNNPLQEDTEPVQVFATGLDSYDELIAKYQDAPFLLGQLQKMNYGNVKVQVHHGVNALYPNSRNAEKIPSAHTVIFNHPHIAQEDARLHTQFLSHLLDAIKRHWLVVPDGALYLTLVVGQWERWEGPLAAERHGYTVVHRSPYVNMPLSTNCDTQKRYYVLRRHQTGKSFALRRLASEVLCLSPSRKCCRVTTTIPPYPFGNIPTPSPSTKEHAEAVGMVKSNDLSFTCNFCDKQFSEARSLKNHVRSKHSSDDDDDYGQVQCTQCERVFSNQQGLNDHMRAVHVALHTNVKPVRRTKLVDFCTTDKTDDTTSTIECPICGFTVSCLQAHEASLVPSSHSKVMWSCTYCQKTLREERALRQHENFCRKRKQTL